MNGKKARFLRANALAHTVGKPGVAYHTTRPPAYANVEHRVGYPARWMKVAAGVPLRLTRDCTRGVYQWSKRA